MERWFGVVSHLHVGRIEGNVKIERSDWMKAVMMLRFLLRRRQAAGEPRRTMDWWW